MPPAKDPWARWARIRQLGRGPYILLFGVIGWGLLWDILMSLFYWLNDKHPSPLMIALIIPLGLVGGYVFGAITWRRAEDKYLAAHPLEAEDSTSDAGVSGAVVPTERPHIVRQPGVCGGSPIIRGTRVAVRQIAVMWQAGESTEQILATFPHLQPACVLDAISYYLDHRDEIEDEIAENQSENVVARADGCADEHGITPYPQQR